MDRLGIYFPSKYKLLIPDPNGGKFPSHKGTDCRHHRRGGQKGGRGGHRIGRRDATFAADWARQSIREQLPSRAAAAAYKVICSGHRLKSNGAIEVSHCHPARANSAAQGLCEACPQMQSYPNSGMSFASIKGIKMSMRTKTGHCVQPAWLTEPGGSADKCHLK